MPKIAKLKILRTTPINVGTFFFIALDVQKITHIFTCLFIQSSFCVLGFYVSGK